MKNFIKLLLLSITLSSIKVPELFADGQKIGNLEEDTSTYINSTFIAHYKINNGDNYRETATSYKIKTIGELTLGHKDFEFDIHQSTKKRMIVKNANEPSSIPTNIPSGEPSSNPSGIPTIMPTINQTVIPSSIPTSNPTTRPTIMPTSNPTTRPSSIPTGNPTTRPSSIPTINQNAIPTGNPTTRPSSIPTDNPTTRPTSIPTGNPTTRPTSIPTINQNTIPTSNPTTRPTSIPTISQPTYTPTVEPTSIPTPISEPSSTPTTVPVMVLEIAQKLNGFPSKELWTGLLNLAFRKSVSDLLTISLDLITNTTATDILDTSIRRKLAVVGILVNYNVTAELSGSDTTDEVLAEIEETLTETTTNSTTGATTSVFASKFMDVIEEEVGDTAAATLNDNLGIDQLTTSTEILVVVLPTTRALTPAPSEAPTLTGTFPTGTPTLNYGSNDEEPTDNTGLIVGITIPIVIIFIACCGVVKYYSYLHQVTPSEVTEQNIKHIVPL